MPEKDTTMRSYDDAAAITAALNSVTNLMLKSLLADRVQDWAALDLLALTHLVIVDVEDTEHTVAETIGFSPLVNPLDGLRVGDDGYVSPWDWAEDHHGWLELMMTVGDSGHALFLFVADGSSLSSDLRALCHADR